MLRSHKPLIMNWFRVESRISSGVVEVLNLKLKLAMRKAYGCKSPGCLKIALYHMLGKLPEPLCLHRFSQGEILLHITPFVLVTKMPSTAHTDMHAVEAYIVGSPVARISESKRPLLPGPGTDKHMHLPKTAKLQPARQGERSDFTFAGQHVIAAASPPYEVAILSKQRPEHSKAPVTVTSSNGQSARSQLVRRERRTLVVPVPHPGQAPKPHRSCCWEISVRRVSSIGKHPPARSLPASSGKRGK